MSKPAARHRARPALEVIEEAVRLLRRAPAPVLLLHLGATAPCALYAVYFFTDLSRSAFAAERVLESALILALLYVVMKCGQAMSAAHLRAALLQIDPPQWNAARLLRLAAAQACLQPLGLLVRALALVIALPYVWTATFFQNAVVLGDGTPASLRALIDSAWREAKRWPLQAHGLAGLLTVFGTFIFANVASLIAVTPSLLKSLFAIESAASRYSGGLWNPTFLVAVYATTYLLLDPLRKAAIVLRCFQGHSLRTGEDLRVGLKAVQRARGAALAVIVAVLFLAPIARAEVPPPPPRVESTELNRSIEEVLGRREFTWRGERDREAKKPERKLSMIEQWWQDFRDWKDRLFRSFAESVKAFFRKLFKERGDRSTEGERGAWFESPLLLYGTCLAAVAAVLAVIIARRWRRPEHTALAEAVAATPDLRSEDVSADQLPEDGWLQLARDLMDRSELRLALRALYLASLAHLGSRQLILLARHKSNHDYERELRRRARAQLDLLTAFERNLGTFEGAWYGDHAVTADTLGEFSRNLDHIRAA